jgi:hypothetical protein
MLAPIRRSRDTLLQFEIDSRGIVATALENFMQEGNASNRIQWPDGNTLVTALDSLIESALLPEEPDHSIETFSPGAPPPTMQSRDRLSAEAGPPPDQSVSLRLAAWLDSFFTLMRDVDHRALEILSLRLEGFKDRDIAEKLGTGLRLVKQITQDIRTSRNPCSG